jgi:GDP-L-fucose synthase
MIAINVIDASFKNKVKKLLFLGSSCIYPRDAHQPMGEDALLTAKLESTNEPYAIAKIAGIKLCESYNRQYEKNYGVDYRSVIPTNLYGPGDNYHPENSHVIPALIQRFHEAKINNEKNVIIWGTGKAKREFLYVDDMAKACIHVLNIDKAIYDQQTAPMRSYLNIGSGQDLTIKELAEMIQVVVGYKGEINFDPTRPDGSPQKLMDSQCINNIGWKHETSLKDGLFLTYKNFIQSK